MMIEEAEATLLFQSIRKAIDAGIDARMAEFDAKLKAIQTTPGPAGPQGPQGAPGESIKGDQGPAGKDAPPVDLVKLAADVVSLIPAPRDGRDGKDGIDGKPGEKGESCDIRTVEDLVSRAVSEAVAAIPKPNDGKDGLNGKDGAPGIQGPPGANGSPGRNGIDGKDGQSIVGPVGAQGPQGERGLPGESIRGEIGPTGLQGEKGLDGKDGRDGREGKDGRDGAPGRDALDIEILSGIDESKSYPRGTFAQHKGGLVRFTGTEWKTIVAAGRSLDLLTVDRGMDDPRRFTFISKFSDGSVEQATFRIPLMIFRGVFQPGKAYEEGDCTVKDGSTWVCLAETTKEAPGTSQDWQLAVKKGKDGKGEKGDKGDPGANGRDLRYQ